MRNLKRVLSLVMAIAMIMSLTIISTSAAFSDQDKIENKDAVDKMVSLNIINGKENGNFDPTGIVTRAEMCKMIYVALSGGNDMKSGSSAVTSFTDTKGHWAEGYIEYCVNMGVVAGMGDNTFAPDQGVTPTQAAKMLLVGLGYDAEYEKFVGATWALNTNKVAQYKSLYDEIQGIDPFAPMSRDNAAQMVNNFCEAPMVKYEYGISGTGSSVTGVKQAVDVLVTISGTEVPQTVLNKYYKLQEVDGYLNDWSYDNKKGEFKYSVAATFTAGSSNTYKTTVDYTDLFGQKVTVMYRDKDNTNTYTSDDSIYDISAKDSMKVMSGLIGDIDSTSGNELKHDKVTYKLTDAASSTLVYAAGENTSLGNINAYYPTAANAQYNFALIDNTGDDKGDLIVVYPYIVEKITYVDSKSVTTNNNTYKFEDCEIYSGIAKNDWVQVVDENNAALDRDTLTKLDVVKGEITSIKADDQIVVDGKTYTNATTVTGDTNYKIGNSVELVIVNGYIFNAKKITGVASSDKLLLVIEADDVGTGTDAGKQQVKVVLADGTKKVVKVDKINDTDVSGTVSFAPGSSSGTYALNTIFTYSIDKDGNYELDPIGATDYDDTKTISAAGYDSGKLSITSPANSTVRFADDAVIFYYTGTEYKAATGATVNSWSKYAAGAITAGTVYANEADGFLYAQVGYLNLPTAPSDKDALYGYITAKPELVKQGEDYYYRIQVWTGTATDELLVEGTGASNSDVGNTASAMNSDPNVQKGTAISYKVSGDKIVDNVLALTSAANAITAYTDGKNAVGFKDTVAVAGTKDLKITSDTKVIRFSSEKTEGQEGDGITVAKQTLGVYTNNCYVVANSDGEIEGLIIDKDSNLTTASAGQTATVPASQVATQAELNALFAVADTVEVTGTYAPAVTLNVPTGKTLNVGTLNAGTQTITVAGTGELNVTGTLTVSTGSVAANNVAAVSVTGNGTVSAAGAITTVTANAGTINATGAIGTVTANAGTITAASTIGTVTTNAATINATGVITTVTANAGTINATGAITTVSANTGTINADSTIGSLTNGTAGIINANGNITTVTANAGTINVKDNLTIGTLTSNANAISVDSGKTLTITAVADMADLNKIAGAAATAKLTLTAGSNDNYTTGMNTFYTVAADGTEVANATKLGAATSYTWNDSDTTDGATVTLAWVADA